MAAGRGDPVARLPPLEAESLVLAERARAHARRAAALLDGVDTREADGPVFGHVRATSAVAHALLALYYDQTEKRW